MKMTIIKYFFRTVFDLGFYRTIGRIKHELKKIIYRFLPGEINLKISNSYQKHPYYRNILSNLKSKKKLLTKEII